MADLSDVSNTLVSLIAATLYPNGPSKPSALGIDVRVFSGWPLPAQLDEDLDKGLCEVSVYPRPENRNTTRYMDQWQQASISAQLLSLTVTGQTVTVAGTIPPSSNPHNLAVFVNGIPYVYRVLATDTLVSIAAALAALMVVAVPGTTSMGATVLLPAAARVGPARVGVTGTGALEIRRQEQLFQIGIWAPTPEKRDSVAKSVDVMLAGTRRFTLPDQSSCRLIWKNSLQSDQLQKANLYRRDLFYTAEYPTLQVETETQITQIVENYSAAIAGVVPYQPLVTRYE
jgi:hypothetical protein